MADFALPGNSSPILPLASDRINRQRIGVDTSSLKHGDDGSAQSSRSTWSETMTEVNERPYYVAHAAKIADQAVKATDPEVAAIYRRWPRAISTLLSYLPSPAPPGKA